MALMVGKGTVLKQDIAASLTAVAQVISINHTGAESLTFDATTLDTSGAGKEYLATGYAEGGSVDFQLFYDSELAGAQSITDDITTPAERDWSVTLPAGTEMTFTSAGQSFGFAVDMDDGVKADVSLKLDQLMAYTT